MLPRQHVHDPPVLVHGPEQIPLIRATEEEHLVGVPVATERSAVLASFSRQLRSERLNPALYGAVGDVDALLSRQLHHARGGEWVAQVPAYGHQDHVGWPAFMAPLDTSPNPHVFQHRSGRERAKWQQSPRTWAFGQAVAEDGHRWFPSEVFGSNEENQTMAENLSRAFAELLRKADAEPDADTLREGVRVTTKPLLELEVTQRLGADRYQRSPERQGDALAIGIGTGIHAWACSSCGSPASAMAVSSPAARAAQVSRAGAGSRCSQGVRWEGAPRRFETPRGRFPRNVP